MEPRYNVGVGDVVNIKQQNGDKKMNTAEHVSGKPLDYTYANDVIDLSKAQTYRDYKERNDCSVRAIATATGTPYDDAHKFCRDVLCRVDRKGATQIEERLEKLNLEPQAIGDVKAVFRRVPENLLKNVYKVHGELIPRKKTVKSFIDSFRVGTYLVVVSNHVFTIKDGCLIDNAREEFRPTRKVLGAVEVLVEEKEKQLDLFDQAPAEVPVEEPAAEVPVEEVAEQVEEPVATPKKKAARNKKK